MIRFKRMRVPLLVLLGGLLVAAPVQAEPVKLAMLVPLSNVLKHFGISAKEGFLLGLQEEAAAHNVAWESWITVEFLDTRVDKDHSLQLAKDAIAGGAKAILGCLSSRIGLALQDYVLHTARIPFIVSSGCATEKLRTPHPLFIRTSFSIPLLTTALARWLIDHPLVPGDTPRWVCIHADYVFGVGVCDAFQRAYGHVGVEIGRVPSPLKTLNKKREIVQLAKLKPDFALAIFFGAEAEVFFKDYYRFKVHIPPN